MFKDLVKPADRVPASVPLRPLVGLLNPRFRYFKSEHGSSILTAWKQARIIEGVWKG